MPQRKHRSHGFQQLEQRHLLSATVFEHDNTAYFLDQADPGFARYDIVNEQWLGSIDLANATGLPTAAHVDDDGIYVAYGKSVYRYGLDGSGQTHLINTTHDIQRLHSDGDLLFVNHSGSLYARFLSIDKSTNTVVGNFQNYVDSVIGSAILPAENRIVGRSLGVSPSDITYAAYNDAGQFIGGGDSPYHGDYAGASEVWAFDDGSRVVDSSGTIYSPSLTYLGSFQSAVDDIDFVGGEVPIVLDDGVVTAYTAAMLPTGSKSLVAAATDIFVNDTNVIAFSGVAGGYSVEVVPLSDLSAPEPGEPVDPVGLAFTPDEIAVAADGTLLLFSQNHQSVFRWDPIRQSYDETIPLIGTPEHMAYSAPSNTIYLAYSTGLLRKIDLGLSELEEVPFATMPASPLGLATAGEYVFAADAAGAWESHYTFAPDGTMISAVEWNYNALDYQWSDVNQKMYFLRDDTSPRDVLWEEINADGVTYPGLAPGEIGAKKDSPLHTSSGFTHPFRVAPDGSVVILGSGYIHDAQTLERLTYALANTVGGIAWLEGTTYTLRTVSTQSQVQAWGGANWGQTDVVQLPGATHDLVAVNGELLVAVTLDSQGVPLLTVYDAELDVVSPLEPVAKAGADLRVDVGSSVILDGSASYDPDESPNPLTYSWDLLSGPGVAVFGSPTQATTTFTAVTPGIYEVSLTVNDGQYADVDTLSITYRLNEAPVADASLSENSGVAQRGPVQLIADASSDPNGDPLSFSWQVVAAPPNSTWTLSSSEGALSTIAAEQPGQYTVELTASDGVLTGSDSIIVTFAENQAPDADPSLSNTMAVAGRQPAVLDGSASTDPEEDPLTYLWEIVSAPAGSTATIQNPESVSTNFSSDTAGRHLLRLTVDDGLKTDAELFMVNVGVNQPPVADASLSDRQADAETGAVRLDGSLSADPDDSSLSYHWQVVASSNDTFPSIASRFSEVASLNGAEPGIYAVELTVSDGASSDADYVIVEVTGNQPPVADASLSDRVVTAGTLPRLDATRSYDPDGDLLGYQWNVVASSVETWPTVQDSINNKHGLIRRPLGSTP